MRLLAPAVLLLVPAAAQAQSPVGQWQCHEANYGPSSTSRLTYDFVVQLNQNGSFQAQGTYYAESNGFTEQFQAQGGWRMMGGAVTMQGQKVFNDRPGAQPFGISVTMTSARSMSYQMNNAGTGRLAITCQR